MSNPRHKARRLATQALYTWQMSGGDLADIDQQYCMEHDMSKVDAAYFHELLHQVPAHIAELDAQITPLLDRPMEEVDPVERAVLRLSTYELLHRLDVPYRVVINEGIMLAKVFGASEGHKYVNSILDGVARQARSVEINAAKNTAKKSPSKKDSSKSATGK